MTSLMSIFDPSISLKFMNSWIFTSVLVSFMILTSYWMAPSSSIQCFKELTLLLGSTFKTSKVTFVMLFIFILLINLLGLLPFGFSASSHLTFNSVMSFMLWSGMMVFYLKNNLNYFLSHLTPQGCPGILVPFMVLIELVSSLIRPLTLALRLMANVMAGHMILVLIGKGICYLGLLAKASLFLVLTGFLMFEFGVAIIQAYVFSSLMSLYWEESVH